MILGVTGPIGCGKSTVLELFQASAWRTADADAICRGMYDDPAGEFAAACRERWGEAFFSNGSFDRAKIAAVVFRDPEQLRRLTELIYPHLERKLDAFAAAARRDGADAAVEVPLLYECGMEKRFDAVLTVWAPEEVRHERLRKFRHFDDAEIRRREARQLAADEKLERADYALVNSGSPEMLKEQFLLLLKRLGTPRRGIASAGPAQK